jgi:hypothetical protein
MDPEGGGAEQAAVFAQAILAGKAASGRRGEGVTDTAPRGDDRDGLARAQCGQIFRKVRVLEVIQDQVGFDMHRE